MRGISAIAVSAMLAATAIHAQVREGYAGDRRGAAWGFGVKGGVNSARAELEQFEDEKDRLGFNAGAIFELGTNRPLSLSFEPTYVVKGTEFDIGETLAEARLNYLEFPVLARLNLDLSPNFRLFGMAGPNVAVNLDADFDEETLLTKDDVEPVDVLLDVGGGAGLGIAPALSLIGEVRYSHGFMDILEEDTEPVQEWNVRDLKVSAGLLWEIPAG